MICQIKKETTMIYCLDFKKAFLKVGHQTSKIERNYFFPTDKQ